MAEVMDCLACQHFDDYEELPDWQMEAIRQAAPTHGYQFTSSIWDLLAARRKKKKLARKEREYQKLLDAVDKMGCMGDL